MHTRNTGVIFLTVMLPTSGMFMFLYGHKYAAFGSILQSYETLFAWCVSMQAHMLGCTDKCIYLYTPISICACAGFWATWLWVT